MARKASTGQLVQSERLHTMGQLVAGVVHELNNPLTIVGSNLRVMSEYTEALLDTPAPDAGSVGSSPHLFGPLVPGRHMTTIMPIKARILISGMAARTM